MLSYCATRQRKISDNSGGGPCSNDVVSDVVNEANFRGVTVDEQFAMTEAGTKSTAVVIALSSRSCRDSDRWETMPSLACFPTLQRIDLHKCRYIEGVHESLVHLKQLRSLSLTGCTRLKSIPSSIGQLQQLDEVSCDDRDPCLF